MKLPIGKIFGKELNDLFAESIKYHLDIFYTTIAEFEPLELYSNWRTIVRSIDEIINIPLELQDSKEIEGFLRLNFNFLSQDYLPQLKTILELLEKRFNKNIAIRFQQLAMMSFAVNESFKNHGIFEQQGLNHNLSNTANSIEYLQARRAYYVATLSLIPQIAKGEKVVPYLDTLNFLQYTMESCLMGITTAYYNLLLNHCLPDFEISSDGNVAKRNFEYQNLEYFFLDPERLSLLDQMELRPEVVMPKKLLPKADNKIFSFSEVANTMSLFEGAFDKYKIDSLPEFKELNSLFYEIAVYIKDDFDVIVEEQQFLSIASKHKALTLVNKSVDYFTTLNSYAPFQKINTSFYSTVVLLSRFAYRTLSQALLKNRTFQINSGFVFEDKVSKILEKKGYALTNFTRIKHKEFDLITIKDNKVYNFQCKNNYIDISRVNYNYMLIGRLNKQLCRYYEKSLVKEENRENLIQDKTGINDIEHFVISRFPVISRNKKIVNFNSLENWKPN
ncbi:MAG: hypothetical protein SFV52_14560 [Saprospiraceae bacterium]|nr:hypothetical protein [Saprospiraceae bacterium]